MSLALILGDPHIGKSLSLGKIGIGSTLNSRITDQFNLLDWVLDYAIDKHIEYIIITGDVWEEPKPSIILITMFMAWLKKCGVHGIIVHIVVGNHDVLRSGNIYISPLDAIKEADFDNVNIYNDIDSIIIDTTSFTFMPYRDRKAFAVSSNAEGIEILRDSLVYELASIPKTYNKVIVG